MSNYFGQTLKDLALEMIRQDQWMAEQRKKADVAMSDYGLEEAQEEHEDKGREPSMPEVKEHVTRHDLGAYV